MQEQQQQTRVPNRPSELGRELGNEVARMTDREEVSIRARFPRHRERCKTCAFRAGTVPNGCEATLMDAIKCVVEGTPFYCHEQIDAQREPTALCAGWAISTRITDHALRAELKRHVTPWEFSCLGEKEGQHVE